MKFAGYQQMVPKIINDFVSEFFNIYLFRSIKEEK